MLEIARSNVRITKVIQLGTHYGRIDQRKSLDYIADWSEASSGVPPLRIRRSFGLQPG